MEYLSVGETATKMTLATEVVRAICRSGWFGRKFNNAWLITDQEIEAYWDGKRIPQDELPKLYDTNHVIEEMGVSRSKFFRLLNKGLIKNETFGIRGGNPNLLFTQEQLDAARQLALSLQVIG